MVLLVIFILVILFLLLQQRKNSITVVSAYYNIPSKRPADEYHQRLKSFLGKLDCNLVFYTSSDLVDTLKLYRQRFIDKTKFIVMEIEDLEFMKRYGFDFWKKQCDKSADPAHIDKPLLGGIWYSKKSFLEDTININPFNSTHFAWIDAGVIEFDTYDNTININENMLHDDDNMYVYAVNDIPRYLRYFDKSMPDYVAGDTYYGSIDACKKHIQRYDEVIDDYLSHDMSIFDDQNILTSLSIMYDDYNVSIGTWRTLFNKIVG